MVGRKCHKGLTGVRLGGGLSRLLAELVECLAESSRRQSTAIDGTEGREGQPHGVPGSRRVTPKQDQQMDPKLFNAADRYLDQIDEALDQALVSAELQRVREALAALGKRLGERYSVTLTCLVEVFDQQQGRTLPLLKGDSTPNRYVVDGQIQVFWGSHRPIDLMFERIKRDWVRNCIPVSGSVSCSAPQ
jgi:hypothetical protein